MEQKKKYSCLNQNRLIAQKLIDNDEDFQETIPEYCDDIFRIVKCCSKSHISSVEINNNEVRLHGKTELFLTYQNDENNLCFADFEEEFTKIIDVDSLSDSAFACAHINEKYNTFRVINQRRIDIHTSFNIELKIYEKKECSYLSSCESTKLRREKINISSVVSSIITKAEFDEEISISCNTPIKKVISSSNYITINEVKIIKDKALIKCTVNLHLLYTTDEIQESLSRFEYSFTLSKIIEANGIDENDILICNADVASIFFKSKNPLNDKLSVVEAYGELSIRTSVIRREELDIITDGYALCRKSECEYTDYGYYNNGYLYNDTRQLDITFNLNSTIKEIKELDIKFTKQTIKSSKLCFGININTICLTDSDLISQNASEGVEIDVGSYDDAITSINISSYDYSLESDNKLRLRLTVEIKSYLYNYSNMKLLSNINISKEKSESSTLSVYFGKKNESLWNIAKSFSSDISLIMAENNLSKDILDENRVLIIPGV